MVKYMIWRWNIGKETKTFIYRPKVYYQPILTYGSETWTWTKKDMRRLQTTEMRFLRTIENVIRREDKEYEYQETIKNRLTGESNEGEKVTGRIMRMK